MPDAENARDEIKHDLDEAKPDLHWLRQRVVQLEAHAKNLGEDVDRDVPIPDTYDALAEWAAERLAGRLPLLPRACRAAKNASFAEPQLAYRALLSLANVYRDVKLGWGHRATTQYAN